MHPTPSKACEQEGSKAKAELRFSKACWVCPSFKCSKPDSVNMAVLSGHELKNEITIIN